ncbi:MAG: hypothetical protein K2H50_05235 [Paramuribaculum sp.]|nr:hypothetical protein [Paramuribaculum sp.]
MMKSTVNGGGERGWAKFVAITGLLLVMVAAVLPLTGNRGDVFRYIYTAGALLVLVGRLFNRCPSNSLRVKRLYRLEVWAGVVFCVGAFFLFYPSAGATDWMAFTLAGGVIEAYASLTIPRAQASEGKK